MKALRNRKGFTLIEVVIVLAIAGLIFVIVFLAVSQAQASRRDTKRKNDIDRVAGLMEQYASNNGGRYPANAAEYITFSSNYVKSSDDFTNPSGGNYSASLYDGAAINCTSANAGSQIYISGDASYYLITICLEKGQYARDSRK